MQNWQLFLDVFGYADDLTLLGPSLAGLKQMLNVCEDYAKEYNILFNAFGQHVLQLCLTVAKLITNVFMFIDKSMRLVLPIAIKVHTYK